MYCCSKYWRASSAFRCGGLLGLVAFAVIPPLELLLPFIVWFVTGAFPSLIFALWVVQLVALLGMAASEDKAADRAADARGGPDGPKRERLQHPRPGADSMSLQSGLVRRSPWATGSAATVVAFMRCTCRAVRFWVRPY